MKRFFLQAFIVLITALLVPGAWSARNAGAWYRGDSATQESLAAGVERWIESPALGGIASGHKVIDGEWVFATYQMAVLGYAQLALEHPETRKVQLARIDHCLEKLLSTHVRAFDTQVWDEDALASLDGDHGHAGYLGYLNLSLSYARLIDPLNRYAAMNDRVTAALVRRVQRSPTLLIETYPRDVYPPDNTAVAGSIALYDKATGANHASLLHAWADRVRRDYRDPRTGLLYQHVQVNGRADSPGRGSGTTLGVYFLSFLDDPISQELWDATKRELDESLGGYGAEREYARGKSGRGDVDSGPLILGTSPVASGFAIAGARLHGDDLRYSRLFATSELFGAPYESDGKSGYVYGGAVGDAIMFAMLTAQPPARVHR